MKRLIRSSLVVMLGSLFAGCAMVKSPVNGGIWTDVSAPEGATSNTGSSKVGTAAATSYLGIIATGDASIQTAASSAGITKIHHVDYNAKSVLFLWAKYTVTVYGE